MSDAQQATRDQSGDDGASAPNLSLSTRIDRLFANYLGDTVLWPVVIAIAGHMAVVIAPLMLGLVRDGSPIGMLGLVALGMPSVGLVRMGWRIDRRISMLMLVGGTWLGAAGLAWIADHYKFY